MVLCALTIAEIGHGIYRAGTEDLRKRRRGFLDELKATVPIHPITDVTAEIIARIGGEQAAHGINLPLGDLIIGATAVELGYRSPPETCATLAAFRVCGSCNSEAAPAPFCPSSRPRTVSDGAIRC
jgi:hypothetical protein